MHGSATWCHYCYRDVGDGLAGRAIAHPGLGRSVYPISTRGCRLCPLHYYLPTQLWVASYVTVSFTCKLSLHFQEDFQKKFFQNMSVSE